MFKISVEKLRTDNVKLNEQFIKLVQQDKENKEKAIVMSDPKKYTPLKNNPIEKTYIDLFIIETSSQYKCPYCDFLKKTTIIEDLRNYYKEINIEETNFQFRIIDVDWGDRFMKDPPYNQNMTQLGKNYFYCIGLGIDRFPAIDIKVKFRTIDKIYSYREQGIGKIVKDLDGNEQIEVNIFSNISVWINNITKGQLINKNSFVIGGHGKGIINNDALYNKIKKEKMNPSLN